MNLQIFFTGACILCAMSLFVEADFTDDGSWGDWDDDTRSVVRPRLGKRLDEGFYPYSNEEYNADKRAVKMLRMGKRSHDKRAVKMMRMGKRDSVKRAVRMMRMGKRGLGEEELEAEKRAVRMLRMGKRDNEKRAVRMLRMGKRRPPLRTGAQ